MRGNAHFTHCGFPAMLNTNALKSSTAVPHYDYDYDEDSLDKQLAVVNAAYDKYNAPATVDTARVRKSTAERKELSAKWGKGAMLYLHTVIGQAAQAMGCYFCTDFTNPPYTYSGDSHLLTYKTGLQEQTGSEKTDVSLGLRIKPSGDFILRTFHMRGYSSRITIPEDEHAWQELAGRIQALLQKFFPKVRVSKKWEINKDPESSRFNLPDGTLTGDEEYTLNEIIAMTANMSAEDRVHSKVMKIKTAPGFVKEWGKLISFKLRLRSHYSQHVAGNYAYYRGEAPAVTSGEMRGQMEYSIGVKVNIKYPKEGAEWMTSCEDDEDFSLLTFLQHIQMSENAVILGKRVKPVENSSSPMSTQRALLEFSHIAGTVKPRMNEDGFTLMEDGRVYFTGMEPDPTLWKKGEDAAYNAETGGFNRELLTGPDLSNKLLMVDWQGNVIVYTDGGRNIKGFELQGSHPLKDVDIGDHLIEGKDDFVPPGIMETLAKHAGTIYVARPSYANADSKRYVFYTHEQVWLANEDPDKPGTAYEKMGAADYAEMLQAIYDNFDTMAMPLEYRIRYRYGIWLMAKYAKPQFSKRYTKAYNDEVNTYREKIDPQSPVAYTNMPALAKIYPQQKRIIGDANVRLPRNVTLGVDVGGGKGTMTAQLGLRYIKAGVVKRPLIVMPKPLKSNYVADLYRFSKDAVRIFPLYLEAWNRMEAAGITLPQLEKIILSQPPNTLFVTDYGFLKLRPKVFIVGPGKEKRAFQFAVWASRVFDMLIADESHKTKNLLSDLSVAFRTAAPYMKAKVLASGTLIFKEASDNLGQMNMFSPNILGANIGKYTENGTNSGKIDNAKLEAFNSRLDRFVKRYYANKREWAFLMPKIIQRLHSVTMNEIMQAVYEDGFKDAMEKLRDSLRKMGIDPDAEENADKVADQAKTVLTPLEIFINAPDDPDSVLAQKYVNLPGVRGKKDMLKSPKIDALDKLLTEHLAKSKNKVLVLSYNKAISKHIMRHSKHVNTMLHYTAEGQKEQDLLKIFESSKEYRVLVADENTLKEGFNLQYCDRAVRMQTVWTVGEFNQALGRVERPDEVLPDGSLKYDRKSITFDWFVTEPSLDVLKTARLFDRIMEKTKLEESDTPDYKAWMSGKSVYGMSFHGAVTNLSVPELLEATSGLLTMSPDNFETYARFDKLKNHADLYGLYSQWLDLKITHGIEALRKAVAEETGIPVEKITDNKLRLAALSVPAKETIEGTKPVKFGDNFTPFVRGVMPPDPYGLDLVPVLEASADIDEDEDGDDELHGEITTNYDISTGDVVITEFGIHECWRKGQSGTIRIDIGERGKENSITVPLHSAFVPRTAEGRARLERIYKSMKTKKLTTSTITVGSDGAVKINSLVTDEKMLIGPKTMSPPKTPITIAPDDDYMDELPSSVKNVPVGGGRVPRAGGSSVATPAGITGRGASSGRPPAKPPMNLSGASGKSPVRVPAGGRTVAPPPVKPPVRIPVKPQVEPPKKVKPAKTDTHAMIARINNQRVIIAMPDGNAAGLVKLGFRHVNKSVTSTIKTWQGLDAMLDYLTKHFTVDQACLEVLEKQLAVFKKNPKMLRKVITKAAVARSFLLNNAKPQKNKNLIFPYLIDVDGELMLFINCDVSRGALTLKNVLAVRGATRFDLDEDIYLRFCTSLHDLEDTLLEMDDYYRFVNMRAVEKQYDAEEKFGA